MIIGMKLFILAIFLLMAVSETAMASPRTDALLSSDVMNQLDLLKSESEELAQNKEALMKLDKNIRTTRKGQSVYLQFKKISGSVLLIGIVIGSYKAYFPPGLRAMLGAYVTIYGMSHGMVRLTEKDIKELLTEISKINLVIKRHESQISKRLKRYCQQDRRHELCY